MLDDLKKRTLQVALMPTSKHWIKEKGTAYLVVLLLLQWSSNGRSKQDSRPVSSRMPSAPWKETSHPMLPDCLEITTWQQSFGQMAPSSVSFFFVSMSPKSSKVTKIKGILIMHCITPLGNKTKGIKRQCCFTCAYTTHDTAPNSILLSLSLYYFVLLSFSLH